jgi:hypothetical protein
MLKNDLQDEIVIKTTGGAFKVLRNGKLIDLPTDELVVKKDDQSKKVSQQPKKVKIIPKVTHKKPAAKFYFHVDDEHDVSKLKDLTEDDKNKLIKAFINRVVMTIFEEIGLQENEETVQFRNIVVSRLRHIRSLAAAREALKASLGRIGKSLSDEEFERFIESIEKKKEQVDRAIKTGKIPDVLREQVEEPDKIVHVGTKVSQVQKSKPVDNLQGVKYGQGQGPEVVSNEALPKHMTMGPVDELRQLSLKEFRRLGVNPIDASEKIQEKIGLLEDESLVKKAEGIKAWKESEVNKVYLAIGAASMAYKKPIEVVIREFKEENKPFLAPEEFNVVADLNKKLSY